MSEMERDELEVRLSIARRVIEGWMRKKEKVGGEGVLIAVERRHLCHRPNTYDLIRQSDHELKM